LNGNKEGRETKRIGNPIPVSGMYRRPFKSRWEIMKESACSVSFPVGGEIWVRFQIILAL
jgi:hypothetical protein